MATDLCILFVFTYPRDGKIGRRSFPDMFFDFQCTKFTSQLTYPMMMDGWMDEEGGGEDGEIWARAQTRCTNMGSGAQLGRMWRHLCGEHGDVKLLVVLDFEIMRLGAFYLIGDIC